MTVSTVKEAQTYVQFQIVSPRFADPGLIQVDDPNEVDPEDRLVALVYHIAGMGTVNVEEKLAPPGMAENLVARAANPDAPPGVFQLVGLREGEQGLLISSEIRGTLLWVEDEVLFQIDGPSVSPAQVLYLGQTL